MSYHYKKSTICLVADMVYSMQEQPIRKLKPMTNYVRDRQLCLRFAQYKVSQAGFKAHTNLTYIQSPGGNRLIPIGGFPLGDSVGGQILNMFNTNSRQTFHN